MNKHIVKSDVVLLGTENPIALAALELNESLSIEPPDHPDPQEWFNLLPEDMNKGYDCGLVVFKTPNDDRVFANYSVNADLRFILVAGAECTELWYYNKPRGERVPARLHNLLMVLYGKTYLDVFPPKQLQQEADEISKLEARINELETMVKNLS